MAASIQKYFQIGTVLWMSFPQVPVQEAVEKIARDEFFSAVEICHIRDDADRQAVCRRLTEAHMTVCYGAQPSLLEAKLNPNDLDEQKRQKAESVLLSSVDEARSLNARGIAFLAGKWEKDTIEESYRQLLKTTRNVCSYAARSNLSVELEVFDYDLDKATLIGPAPLAARFAADMRMSHNNFGLLVDLSHIPTTYETPSFVVRTLRPYITHFHIGNAVVRQGCEAYGDLHPRFGFPNGSNDTAELLDFFRVLKAEGFFNAREPYILSIEVKPWPGEDPDSVLAGTKRVINRAWSLLEDNGGE